MIASLLVIMLWVIASQQTIGFLCVSSFSQHSVVRVGMTPRFDWKSTSPFMKKSSHKVMPSQNYGSSSRKYSEPHDREGIKDGENARMTPQIPEENASIDDGEPEPLGSLDAVLKKARRRKGISFQYKLQALWDSPLIRWDKPFPLGLTSSLSITVGDVGLALAALLIDAKGFALGYFFGKITSGPLREVLQPIPPVQTIIGPLWPVLWAIGFDQIL